MPTSPSDKSKKIKIGITLGDPAGIGPEVALKAVHEWADRKDIQIIFLGPESFYQELSKKLKFKNFSNATYFPYPFPKKICFGRCDNAATQAAVSSIELAVSLAMDKKIDAIVTPPINKAGLKKAGFDIPGHTEYLAKLSGTKKYEMMLVGGKLKTVLVTRHTAIKDVPSKITKNRVEETILMTDFELRKSFGIKNPRIVVCGLNPHAGESGSIGCEEIKEIIPAAKSARKKTNATIIGPLSPDALFVDAYLGKYDAEVCMYHDQGLIPLKMISRGHGVNVTLGLPFVRTSPDHGTAYDIAGKFVADSGSMSEALKLACQIVQNRRRYAHSYPRS